MVSRFRRYKVAKQCQEMVEARRLLIQLKMLRIMINITVMYSPRVSEWVTIKFVLGRPKEIIVMKIFIALGHWYRAVTVGLSMATGRQIWD